ncbi:hypothetical protein BRD00_14435 [Halobacteriales archaeon QS_8_69_26]|nr:MAG: hypothetical protein BRD00_14435 [Halobacteriales archaeon QS_8_69_26]
MATLTRRLAVQALALPVGMALAGCLDGSGDGGDDTEYELHQVGPTTAVEDWSGRDGATGAVELYRSRSRAEAGLDDGILAGVPEERHGPARTFVDETEFDRSVLLYVASEGPDTCHDEIAVRSLDVEARTVTGRVAARDTSEEAQDD